MLLGVAWREEALGRLEEHELSLFLREACGGFDALFCVIL